MSLGRKECHSIGKNSSEKRAEVVSYRSNIRTWAYIKVVEGWGREAAQSADGNFCKSTSAEEDGCSKKGQQGEVISEEGNAINIPAQAAVRHALIL